MSRGGKVADGREGSCGKGERPGEGGTGEEGGGGAQGKAHAGVIVAVGRMLLNGIWIVRTPVFSHWYLVVVPRFVASLRGFPFFSLPQMVFV